MGHIRLGSLPRTKRWREVVDLVGTGASSAAVAAATVDAIDENLSAAAGDPGLVRSLWLLSRLPDAARSADFGEALRELGLEVQSSTPSSAELAAAFSLAVDSALSEKRHRSDVGEMAQAAAVEVLSREMRERTASLFGTTPDDIRRELGKLATEAQFGRFMRGFFSRFVERCLTYYVSKELPRHIGQGHRFESLADKKAFTTALSTHCLQASKIVESFAGGWYSKARFEKDLSEERTARFVAYALKKVRDELRQGAAE